MSPEEAYKYDNTFRRVVDLMRAHLSVYEITPAELRQAAMLAATMHEAQRVRPLIIRQPYGVFIDEAKDIPPAMFGGMMHDKWSDKAFVEEQLDEPNWGKSMVGEPPPKSEHRHIFNKEAYRDYSVCECGMSDVYYNWAYPMPKKDVDFTSAF